MLIFNFNCGVFLTSGGEVIHSMSSLTFNSFNRVEFNKLGPSLMQHKDFSAAVTLCIFTKPIQFHHILSTRQKIRIALEGIR